MAVGAKQSEVLQRVVVAVPVDVMERHGGRRGEPLGDPAALAAVHFQALRKEPGLQMGAVDSTAVDQVCLDRRAVRTRDESSTSRGVHQRLASEPESRLAIGDRMAQVVEPLDFAPVVAPVERGSIE